MKVALLLCVIVAVAAAAPVDKLRELLDKIKPDGPPKSKDGPKGDGPKGDGPKGDGRKGDGPKKRIEFMPPLEGEEARPVTAEQVLGLLKDVGDVSGKIRKHFEDLKDKADNIDGSEASLVELGEHTGGMLGALSNINDDELDAVRGKWFKMMQHLEAAGVEDEGQCHKLIVWLIKVFKEYKEGVKREMGEDELQFWLKVVEVSKEEVGCIIGRFDEFMEMVRGISDAIQNPPADYSENGHAFEAEILMGSLFAGYRHLFRQVVVFAYTVGGLMECEEERAGDREPSAQVKALESLYEQAEMIRREMEALKGFDKKIR